MSELPEHQTVPYSDCIDHLNEYQAINRIIHPSGLMKENPFLDELMFDGLQSLVGLED